MKRQNDRIETPEMEVNWEAIDRKFAANLAFTPQLVDDEATVAGNRLELYTQPVLIPHTLSPQRPNVIENNANSTLSTHPIILQKPDGNL